MSDVFISYSSEDRERVRPLAQALEAKGLSVWWDRALAAGDDYAAVIQKALDEARAVIVVWSRNSVDSPWVRDEAGRARDTKRLTPILLDRVTIPMGFGAINAEDFTDWNGSGNAAQVQLLLTALTARLDGKAPTGIDALRRKSLKARIRLVTVLTVAALLVAIAAGGLYIADRDKRNTAAAAGAEQTASSQTDLNRLLELVASGKLSGDQAVELAKLLQNQAFVDVPPPAQAAAASVAPEAQTASISAEELDSNAKATFQDAAAQLLKDPDPQVREAAVQAAAPETRAAGMERLWTIAKANGPSSAAIYRYCGAIGSLTDDSRTRVALERARDANPNDMRLWRLLSADYSKAKQSEAARGAKLVGDGLSASANGQGEAATANLEQALPLLEQPGAKAFVLGQLGDAAAKRDDWAAAEKRYSAAVDLQANNNVGAAAIDTAKLARAQAQQGDRRRACQTLQRAKRLGVNAAPAQMEQLCQTGAPSAAPQP